MTWALLYLFIGTATATYMADKATKEDWYNGESVAWRKQPFSTKVAVWLVMTCIWPAILFEYVWDKVNGKTKKGGQ